VVQEEVAGIPTVEGRDIEEGTPTEVLPQDKTTELTVRAIVLQTQLYGWNVPYTTQVIPLDSGATIVVTNARASKPVTRTCLQEEDTEDVAMAVAEEEGQHQLLLPHQSQQEPGQS
jgi:hypothetical protein